jgi:hypothetical protein
MLDRLLKIERRIIERSRRLNVTSKTNTVQPAANLAGEASGDMIFSPVARNMAYLIMASR